MTTTSDIDNQIHRFNATLRLESKLDRMGDRIDRRFDRIDQRFDRLESRVARIEDAIFEIRDYIHRSAPRGLGFNPTAPASIPQQENDEA